MKPLSLALGLALLAGLAACGDKPQNMPARSAASPAYLGIQGGAYVAPGWKPGDQASWEEKIRARTQAGQNEYQRAAGRT